MWLQLVVTTVIAMIPIWVWAKSRPRNFPPGPIALPVVGNVLSLSFDKHFRSSLHKLHESFGPIVSLSIVGSGLWDVYVQGPDLIREVLHDPRFSSRSLFGFFKAFDLHKTVTFGSGKTQKERKKVLQQILRNLGLGKSSFTAGVEQEVAKLLKYLDAHGGVEPVDMKLSLSHATNNVIMKILFNQTFEYDDPEYNRMYNKLQEHFELLNPILLHWHVPGFISKHMDSTKRLMSTRQDFLDDIFSLALKSKPDTSGVDLEPKEPSCVAEALWNNVLFHGDFTVPVEDFSEFLGDIFVAGQETTTTTLNWAFLNLLHNPHVEKRMYEEVMKLSRDSDFIGYKEHRLYHYTMAALSETQRYTPVLPSTLDHTANCNITDFHGFYIPKGTRLMPNMIDMSFDARFWKHPKEFNPENFLNDEGQFCKNYYLMPFSTGPRVCPGESLANTELFTIFANVVKRYKILPVDGVLPDNNPVVRFIIAPKPYKVVFKKREPCTEE